VLDEPEVDGDGDDPSGASAPSPWDQAMTALTPILQSYADRHRRTFRRP
jgi:hypothetical protein